MKIVLETKAAGSKRWTVECQPTLPGEKQLGLGQMILILLDVARNALASKIENRDLTSKVVVADLGDVPPEPAK